MYEFGEELIIESNKLPWLIWIQLLIMILLVVLLLFGFSIFSMYDESSQSSTAASSSQVNNSRLNNNSSNSFLRNTTVEEIQTMKGNAGACTSRVTTRDEIQETEGSPTKDSIRLRPFQLSGHPCHFLGLAKQAFLKCLGLEPSESTDKRRHLKDD